MIVRETESHFICIEQDHHAHLSKQMIAQWKDYFLQDDPLIDSVLFAVEQHDIGWHHFDRQPLWNDQTRQPYTFIDLPLLIKTVLYTNGVNIVEEKDPYAAALCSAHYTKFLQKYEIDEVKHYIKSEQLRRETILQLYPHIDKATFNRHLAFLQLADNMSLYICLHEPGNNKNIHRYFQRGIRIPPSINRSDHSFIEANWQNNDTIYLNNIERTEPFSLTIHEKYIPKEKLKQGGLINLYEQTSITKRQIHLHIS